MRAFRGILAVLLALTAAGGALAPAALGSGQDVIRDCTDDERFSKTYTQKEYRDALANLSTDTDEYTNCRAVIRRAQLAAAGRRSGQTGRGDDASSGGAGGETGGQTGAGETSTGAAPAPAADPLDSASAAERRALEDARAGQGRPVDLDGVAVDPTTGSSGPGLGELPAPLVVLLLGLLAGVLALGARRVMSSVRTRRA